MTLDQIKAIIIDLMNKINNPTSEEELNQLKKFREELLFILKEYNNEIPF